MDDMYSGSLVLFFQHGELAAGFCTAQADTHLQVLCTDERHVRIPVQRVVHAQPLAGVDAQDTQGIVGMLAAVADQQIRLAETIDTEALWSALDRKDSTYSTAELARTAFGEQAGSDHAAAVVRALQHDRVYFKFNGERYLALSLQQVELARECAAQDNARRMEIERCAAWLNAFVNGREPDDAVRGLSLGYLRQFAVFGTGAPQYAHIRSIFQHAGLGLERRECFNLLVREGVFSVDENMLFERYGVPCTWPEGVLREVDARVAAAAGQRCDLRSLEAWSIDDPGTRDIDDAISLEQVDGDLRVGIHITDAASLLPPGCALDLEASKRGTSLYLPEGTIPMLPPALSEKRLSLIAGEERPVVSVFITLDAGGSVRERTLQLSTIRVTRRLSYQDVDDDIRSGGVFQHLYEHVMRARERRLTAGASGMVIPELQIRLESSREVVLHVRERETPAQALVAECMILANHSAALYLKQHSVPALYRTQKPGRFAGAAAREDLPLTERLRLRHAFNRTILDISPRAHAGLGLDCYCSTTSPMRKYLDLVMQRQLVAALQAQEPVYEGVQLRNIAAALQPVLTRASLVENERRRYWLLKKMESLQGQTLRAVVISRRKKAYTVLLTDFLLELSVESPDNCCYDSGSEVQVLLKDIDPFYGSISVCMV